MKKRTKYYNAPVISSDIMSSEHLKRSMERACTSKVAYPTVELANEQGLYLRSYIGLKDIYPYRCRFCEYYHLGHRH